MPHQRAIPHSATALVVRIAALMLVGAALPGPARAQPPSVTAASAVDTSIQALFAAIDARWNARDAAGLAALHTPDTDVSIRGLPRLRGQAALRDAFGPSFAAGAVARHRTVVSETELIAPGIAVAEGRVLLDAPPADTTGARRQLSFVSVVTKASGGWQVRLLRAAPEQVGGSAPPQSGPPR